MANEEKKKWSTVKHVEMNRVLSSVMKPYISAEATKQEHHTRIRKICKIIFQKTQIIFQKTKSSSKKHKHRFMLLKILIMY